MRSRLTPLLLVASVAALLAGCTGQTESTTLSTARVVAAPSSSTSLTTTTPETVVPIDEASGLPAGKISAQAFGYGATHDPETMFADEPIVVAGVITEVSPARWNSADGKRWPKDLGTDADAPMLYRLVQVTVTDVLKGKVDVGTTIGVIVYGQRMTEYATAEEDGDPIKSGLTAIAAIEPVFAGAWGPNAVWPAGAYFAYGGANGLMLESHESFINALALGVPKDNREPGVRGITLEEARGIAEKSRG
ncbi:MAG: hypothetical protein ACYC6T_12570 [Thermoleophilia bacterium]